MARKSIRRLLLIAGLFASFAAAPGAAAGDAPPAGIRIGFVVASSPDYVVMQWYPMITYLTEAIGRPFDIVVRDSYEDMLEDYRKGEIDLLVGGPFNYVKTEPAAGAVLVAGAERTDAAEFRGVIVVESSSSARSLADLKGGSFAFTEPYSTTGYLMPRLLMAAEGIPQPEDFFREVVFTGHHAESLEAVRSGHVDAAAFVSYLLKGAPEGREAKLRVIATTPVLPPEPIFARPGFDPAAIGRIREALLAMDRRVSPEVMKHLGLARFVAVGDGDYDEIRRMEQELAALPPIPYAIDYGLMPAAISQAEARAWARGWKGIMAAPAVAALLLVLAVILLRRRLRRDLRLKFAASLVAAMVLVALVIGGLTAANLRERLGNITLTWQRHINLFTAQASSAAGGGDIALIGLLADGLAAQEGFRFVRVLHNGTCVADSEHRETGLSIIPKILSGTFRPPEIPGQSLIAATAHIMAGPRRFGSAQIAIDTGALSRAVAGACYGNLIAVAVLLALGAAIALLWSRLVARPVERLQHAVADLRAGRRPRPGLAEGEDQIGELARGFSAMALELGQTDELLRLREQELGDANRRLAELAGAEERLEEAIEEMDDGPGPCDAALDAIKGELGSMAQATAMPEADVDALRQKIAEIETELPLLADLRAREIIGSSPAFLRVIRDIVIRARDADPVLLHGASGSGKTGVARAIHLLSARGGRPIVEVNCAEFAAADPAIVLGKLFGFGRDCGLPGIAREGQRGLLEECDGATLFLDEIALLPPQAQGALLLPLEGRPFNPAAGKGAPRSADVRFIFASNARLEEEVAANRFRNDLLRRIRSRGCIDIPPLSERLEDVPQLARHFLGLWVAEKGRPMTMTPEVMRQLEGHGWHHFNVAELASAIKVAADNALFREADAIRPEHLPDGIAAGGARRGSPDEERLFDAEELREIAALRRSQFRMAAAEAELGYARDAKTLSNHLRGLAYKVLALGSWRAEEAAAALAGDDAAAHKRVGRKIDFYLANAAELARAGQERRLYNNLPQKYHRFAEEVVAHVRAPSPERKGTS